MLRLLKGESIDVPSRETQQRAANLVGWRDACLAGAEAALKARPATVSFVPTRSFWRPQELSPTGQGYHWNSNAETYDLIGDGMGQAMVELLGRASTAR